MSIKKFLSNRRDSLDSSCKSVTTVRLKGSFPEHKQTMINLHMKSVALLLALGTFPAFMMPCCVVENGADKAPKRKAVAEGQVKTKLTTKEMKIENMVGKTSKKAAGMHIIMSHSWN